jgi:hypothetical protein
LILILYPFRENISLLSSVAQNSKAQCFSYILFGELNNYTYSYNYILIIKILKIVYKILKTVCISDSSEYFCKYPN